MMPGAVGQVFRAIERGCVTVPSIARHTGISEAKVRTYVTRLRRRGHIKAARKACNHCGCRAATYAPVKP